MKQPSRSVWHGRYVVLVACAVGSIACDAADQPRIAASEHVGDGACVACHPSAVTFQETAHHHTSMPASSSSIHGSFDDEHSVLRTSNPYLHFRLEARSDGFYQTAVLGQAPDTSEVSERFDLVIGSGRRGQSYLYWRDDRLYQLPISYWTQLGDWVNSPGYRDGVANFDREITPRCLECHATFFESAQEPHSGDGINVNRYDRTNYILGVSCERCHGPGREHVERRRAGSREWLGSAIINPAKLPRARQLELCALCHGGGGEQKAPAFTYVAGEPLSEYLALDPPAPGEAADVHGNQVGLLSRSQCFQASSTMTCSTCHDVHASQRDAASFSPACLECHQVESCGLFPARGTALAENCVDCHMPRLPSQAIVSTHDGRLLRPKLRTHWIKVYPESASEPVGVPEDGTP